MVVETQHKCFKLQKGQHTTSLTNEKNTQILKYCVSLHVATLIVKRSLYSKFDPKNTQILCFTIFCGEWTQGIPKHLCTIVIQHDIFCGYEIFLAKVNRLKRPVPVDFQMRYFPKMALYICHI